MLRLPIVPNSKGWLRNAFANWINASAKRAIVQIWTIADPKISILDNSVFILDNKVFLLVTRGEEGW